MKLHKQGKFELDGPFLVPDVGGKMVATKDVTSEEIEAFAAAARLWDRAAIRVCYTRPQYERPAFP